MALSILIGGVLLDVLMSIVLGVFAFPMNIIIGTYFIPIWHLFSCKYDFPALLVFIFLSVSFGTYMI